MKPTVVKEDYKAGMVQGWSIGDIMVSSWVSILTLSPSNMLLDLGEQKIIPSLKSYFLSVSKSNRVRVRQNLIPVLRYCQFMYVQVCL